MERLTVLHRSAQTNVFSNLKAMALSEPQWSILRVIIIMLQIYLLRGKKNALWQSKGVGDVLL